MDAVHTTQNQSVAAAGSSSGIVAAHTGRSLDGQQQPTQQYHQYQPMLDSDKSPVSIGSNVAGSSCNSTHSSVSSSSSNSTTTSTSSAPQYSEDLRRTVPTLDLLPRQGSASSTKTCEVDLGDEERDTFSPISSDSSSGSNTHNSPSGVVVVPHDAATAAATTSPLVVGVCNGAASSSSSVVLNVDNKVRDGALPPLKLKLNNGLGSSNLHSTSKEEKQRQNEEIVIMETSSVSSETGSWESIFPHTAAATTAVPEITAAAAVGSANVAGICDADLRNCCTDFLQNERKELQVNLEKPKDKNDVELVGLSKDPILAPLIRERTYSSGATVTADTSSLFTGVSTSSLLRDLDKRDNALSTSGTSACFIDASSLRDEDEVLSFPSLDGHQSNDELDMHEKDADYRSDNAPNDDDDDDSPTKKLETFHKSFAMCRAKSKDTPECVPLAASGGDVRSKSSSSSNSDADSPQKVASAASVSSNNLSDEEKLWKREHATQKVLPDTSDETKDQIDMQQPHAFYGHEDATEASVSFAADVDSSDSSEVVKLRREQERRQVPCVFQHNMQQFSIHPLGVSPKFTTHNIATHHIQTLPNAAHATQQSDLSYTTDYSSSSPAPSLVWSEHEHRPSTNMRNHHQHHHSDDYDGHIQKPSLMPDTPHNSIVHIDPGSSNNSSIHRDYTLSSSLSQQRDSGAYCSDATDSPIPMPRTPKRSKFDEANPIVSGGASIKDFNIKQCESPPIKRRTETCPIVSGGFVSLDFQQACPLNEDDDEEVELRAKPKTRKPIPGIASWVVDMSDCRPERRKSTSSTSSLEVSSVPSKFRERSDSTSSHKSGCGFYVSLEDMDKKPDDLNKKAVKTEMSKSYTSPKPSGFFVNLSKSEYQPKNSNETPTTKSEPPEAEDKQKLFSMFIDIGDKKSGANGARKEPFNLAQRLSSSITSTQRRSEEAMKSSASSTETLMSKSNNFKAMPESDAGESKSLDYKCNLDPPTTVAAIRRISQQRAQSDAAKRHSWGTNQAKDNANGHDYKRSISLTANGGDGKGNGNGLMSIIDKLPIISKASSLSIDSSLSPYDEYMGSKSELSTSSNNSARHSMSGGERDDDAQPATVRIKKRRRDVQINETFDKSSLASITDGILSKDLSPASTTDTDDLTFQQDEELAIREAALQQQMQQIPSNRSSAIIMETIIEAKETASPKKNASGHTMETLHATIEKQKMLLETVNEHGEVEKSTFVKLSDMDKPVRHELHSPETIMSKSVGNHRQINRLFRDESKARTHSWTMTRSTGNSFLNITNSVENMRSLSRLFPNFSKEFSNSLPNDMTLEHSLDYVQTDISADSSLASSFSRSGMDESSMSCRQPRRLGEDLLKMFLQEIATDMIVEVHGRRMKAHQCILRSRCQYFAAMLAGNNAQTVVSLQGYSHAAVHFALCHIYSGASHPPDGISLMELAALADLLGLEGLKEVTAHALKTNYCHNFHKPCSGCIDGILQVLPVALNHALDDLYRKCLRWTCRHYLRVWPTRQFAQLPHDILGRCRQQIVAYLTSETVLDTVLDCDNLLAQLATYRWGGICENLVRDILDAVYAYIADHFASLIASDAFLSLGHDRSCHIPRLESILLRTASALTPDQACRSYQRITRLNTVLQAKILQMPADLGALPKELQGLQEEDLDWDAEFIRLVSALLSTVEQCLIKQCSRAMRVTAWQRMDLDLRKKIQTLARLTEPLDMKRSSRPVSKAYTFSSSTRNQDLYQVKLAIQAHSKRALAQDTQLYKATQTQDAGNVQTTERGVQASNDLREGNSKILKSNSRAHVPQSMITQRATSQSTTTTVSERNSINTHRRTQSEARISTTKNAAPIQKSTAAEPTKTETAKQAKLPVRLADVRPRYLEPRKAHINGVASCGPIRSATSSSIPATNRAKNRQISSSDSSRNSSPAARKNIGNATTTKIGTKSTNMSLDSLASLTRRAKNSRDKCTKNERYTDLCVESLADSLKSSMITNKTISQESLTQNSSKLTRSNPLIGNNNNVETNRQTQSVKSTTVGSCDNAANRPKRPTTLGPKAPKHLQHKNIASTGSSPSSVTTTKSAASRLSSVSSTHSSRDLFKHRSISMPGGAQDQANSTTGGQQRRSFLSAKSREILAKRAEKNKQLQLQQQQQHNSSGDEKTTANGNSKPHNTGPMRSASTAAVPVSNLVTATTLNRNALPSNIPTRRPNTLSLKKVNGCNVAKAHVQPTHPTTITTTANNNHNNKTKIVNATNGILKATAHAVKQKIELLIDNATPTKHCTANAAVVGATRNDDDNERIESKLERSSTFCKESSDLDMNELQIIE